MKKIEVHLFSDSTNSGKKFQFSISRIVWVLVGITAAVIGFILFSPAELSKLILDRQIVKIYQENKALKQEIQDSEQKLANAKAALQKTNAMRDTLFSDKTIRHILNVPKGNMPLVTAKENFKDVKANLDSLYNVLKDKPELAGALPIALPLKGRHTITNRYQMIFDAFTQQDLPHKGVDFTAVAGDTVFAPGNGTVLEQRTHRGFGVTLKIEHSKHLRTFYAHLKEVIAQPGKAVKRGDPIAIVGNTGRATGTVLHYEIRYDGEPINPENYILMETRN